MHRPRATGIRTQNKTYTQVNSRSRQTMGSSSRHSSQEVQARILLILIILTGSLDFVAPDDLVGMTHAVETGTLVLADKLSGKVESLSKYKDFIKGAKTGAKAEHKWDKLHNQVAPPAPLSSGMVDAVQVAGNRWLPVRTADITDATAAVRIEERGGCVAGAAVHMPPESISLFGGNAFLGGLRSARYWVVCLLPATATATRGASSAVLGLGRGGELASSMFATFSYQVWPGENIYSTTTKVWVGPGPRTTPASTTIPLSASPNSGFPGRYYVRVTGIRVGNRLVVRVPPGPGVVQPHYGTDLMYLSTNADDPFTYLDSALYTALKAELLSHYLTPQRWDREQLCYGAGTVPWASFPPISIVFNDDEAAVMNVRSTNLWYNDGPNVCLAILPSTRDKQPVLGSFLQTGMLMTISRHIALITTYTLAF